MRRLIDEKENAKPKDNICKGIIFITIYAITLTATGVFFKRSTEFGVDVLDFQIFRAIFMGLSILPIMYFSEYNGKPVHAFDVFRTTVLPTDDEETAIEKKKA